MQEHGSMLVKLPFMNSFYNGDDGEDFTEGCRGRSRNLHAKKQPRSAMEEEIGSS